MNKKRLLPALVMSGLFAGGPLHRAEAQQAVTVSGHVTAAGAAVVGAQVRVTALKIERATDAEGRYSFIVPSVSVHGQTVRVTVSSTDRRVRYAPAYADIKLVGGPMIQDFDLKITSGERPAEPRSDTLPPDAPRTSQPSTQRAVVTTRSVDSASLGEIAGPVDLASALAGRVPGLSVTEPGVLGGSTLLSYRGSRSILGMSQPLIVVDGVPLDNTVFTSTAQRFGVGGYDYGSPIQDIDLANVASWTFLSAAEGASRFGGRAANGVLVVTTKNGADGPGLAISASQQITTETPGRLPKFQNQYGQGLNGQFQFFNGRGGGINDGVDESWGPLLDSRPLSQASFDEPGIGDVRLWTAHPSNVTDYFANGRTLNSAFAIQGATDLASFRGSFGNRDSRGLTPLNTLVRRNGTFHLGVRPMDGLSLAAWIAGGQTVNQNAPGTGFNQGNPVAEFTRLGRQVDGSELRRHLVDSLGKQISWHYAGQNNPYFASLENSNRDERNHVAGGGTATLALSPWLNATVQGGTDYYRTARTFTIRSGWMGGFPFFAAPAGGNFSKGGFEGDEIYAQETNASLRFDGNRTLPRGVRLTLSVGGDAESSKDRIRTVGIDSAANLSSAGAPDTATIPQPTAWNAHARTNAVFGEASVLFPNGSEVRGGLRNEWASILPGQHAATLYPSIQGKLDLLRAVPSMRGKASLNAATVRAAWSRSAGQLTPYTVQTLYAGRTPSGAVAPVGAAALSHDANLAPEITSGWQLGSDLSLLDRSVDLGFTLYHESTSGVILPVTDSVLRTVQAKNAASVGNSGIEGWVAARMGDPNTWLGWEVSANAGKNSNSVDRLYAGVGTVNLAPSQWGLIVQARTGSPIGVLAGYRFLRDGATGALLLRGGLPLPDTAKGVQELGVAQPDWVFGLRNTLRFRWLSASALVDGRIGGSIFSATNLWGSYAGSLEATAFRPDSGLLITGIDADTKKANTQHVSTQNYYHALGAIQEPWVYDASYFKVREVRAGVTIPTGGFASLPFSSVDIAFVARNVYLSAKAPNIDPETLLSPYQFGGIEMGQLPATKSVGFQISFTP